MANACYVTGFGSAIAGVGGMGGALVDHQLYVDRLVAAAAHNPLTGKPVERDWAARNLGSGTVAIAHLEPVEAHVGFLRPEGARSATEQDLFDAAAHRALDRARTGWERLDAVIHVSPTAAVEPTSRTTVGFQEHLRELQFRYPLRPDCALYHLACGCSGVTPALHLARGLLATGESSSVLVVCSVWGGPLRDNPAVIGSNDIDAWIAGVLFGDAAGALVLTSSAAALAPGDGYLSIERFARFTDASTWISRLNDVPGLGRHLTINPLAAKAMFIEKLEKTIAHLGKAPRDFAAMAIHQPNSEIVQRINRKLGCNVHDIAHRYGNLVAASAVVNLDETLRAHPLSEGDQVLLFTLGADAGMTWGGATGTWLKKIGP